MFACLPVCTLYHIHKLTRKFPLSTPALLWRVLSEGLSYPWHSLVVPRDAESEVCVWLHHSSTRSFPCSPMIGELLVFNSTWETQMWRGISSPVCLKALSTNALEMWWLPELQAVLSPSLSSRANFFLSFCFLPFDRKQTKVTEANIHHLRLHAVTFVVL